MRSSRRSAWPASRRSWPRGGQAAAPGSRWRRRWRLLLRTWYGRLLPSNHGVRWSCTVADPIFRHGRHCDKPGHRVAGPVASAYTRTTSFHSAPCHTTGSFRSWTAWCTTVRRQPVFARVRVCVGALTTGRSPRNGPVPELLGGAGTTAAGDAVPGRRSPDPCLRASPATKLVKGVFGAAGAGGRRNDGG